MYISSPVCESDKVHMTMNRDLEHTLVCWRKYCKIYLKDQSLCITSFWLYYLLDNDLLHIYLRLINAWAVMAHVRPQLYI